MLDLNGKADSVSIDRLKVAYLEDNLHNQPLPSVTPKEPPPRRPPSTDSSDDGVGEPNTGPAIRKTRCGRHVRWPKKFVQVVYT